MALTPEDVVNKRFNATKFREGYDQDEVDDFLDEVVVELRRLNQENDELRQRLVAGESRINELQRGGAAVAAPAQLAPVVAPEPVAVPAPVAEVAPAPVEASAEESTNNLLQLARQVHDQHVREGAEQRDAMIADGTSQRDAMIADGTSQRDALIAEGHATAARVVSEAQETARVQLANLNEQKGRLEQEISALESFEAEYRSKLKSYIEGQLAELEANQTVAARPAATAQPTGSSAHLEPVYSEPAQQPESTVFSLPPFPDASTAAAPAGYDFPAPQAEDSGLPGRS